MLQEGAKTPARYNKPSVMYLLRDIKKNLF
jgi:hypothetical protein